MDTNPYASPRVDSEDSIPVFMSPLFWVLNLFLLITSLLLIRMFVFIPIFRGMYAGLGSRLPILTRIVISYSFQWGAPIGFILGAVAMNVYRYHSQSRSHKSVFAALVLGLLLFVLALIGTYLPVMSM